MDGQIKKVHEVEIEILDKVVDVCKKYNIQYFLVYGTLLGAVRHKGFIPWDDDIDIGMLRSDYNKFIDVCTSENALGDKYFLHCDKSDDKYFIPFIKVKKNNTTFAEECIENVDTHKGFFLDIFPFDNVPKQKSKLQKLQAIIVKNIVDAIYVKYHVYSLKSRRRKMLVALFLPFSGKTLKKWRDRTLTWFDKKDTKYVVDILGSVKSVEKDTMIKEKMFPLKPVKFGTKNYNGLNDNDYYLSKVYGDYMKLPPENKRRTHMPTYISFTEGECRINEN